LTFWAKYCSIVSGRFFDMKNCLKQIRGLAGLTLKDLSKLTGAAVSTIGNFENGKTEAGSQLLQKLANALQVTPSQLLSERYYGKVQDFTEKNCNLVPVISWARAGVAVDYNDLQMQLDEMLPTTVKDENAFALIIEGDSMEPEFFAGDRVIISPNTMLRNGDFVVARFKDDDGVLFKEYRRTGANGETIQLKSLNPLYSTIERHVSEFRFIYPALVMSRFLRDRK